MKKDHTVRSFDKELDQLRTKIAEMGKASAWQIAKAAKAFSKLDIRLAEETVKSDSEVNKLFKEVEDLTVTMIAKRQPLAIDLRHIIACLRMATNLERVADYAANIAKYALTIEQISNREIVDAVLHMTKCARQMLDDVTEGYLNSEVSKVNQAWHLDDEIDNRYALTVSKLRKDMEDEAESIETGTTLLFIARCCERIGDHITNVAENVHYILTNEKYPVNQF